MAWTAPRTWATGELVTAALMNTHLRDNLRYMKGLDGAVTFSDAMIIADGAGQYLELPSLTTVERDAIGAPVAGMVIWNSTNSLVEYYTGAAWDDVGERDHGSLAGLADDDHNAGGNAYHTDGRHDARNANTHADITSAGADIDDAVTKKHTQNTDTQLGNMAADINMNTHQVTNLAAPAAGEALRKGQTDVTDAEVAAANKDGVAATASMRTLGTGAQQAAAGDHTHTLAEEDSDENETTGGNNVAIGTAIGASTTDNTDVTSNPDETTRLCGTNVCATGGAVGAGDKFALIIDGVEQDSVTGAGANTLAVLKGSKEVASGARTTRGQLVTDATAAQREWFCGVTAIGVSI